MNILSSDAGATAEARRCLELGDSLRARGRLDEAGAAYRSGLKCMPGDGQLTLRLGRLLLAQNRAPEAAARFHGVARNDPAYGEARILEAHALKLAGNFAKATAIILEMSKTYPNQILVTKELGRLYAAQLQLDPALACFQEVVAQDPRDADAHHWLANLEYMKGNAAASRAHFRDTIALQPVVRVPAVQKPPAFSVLFVFLAGGANTPPDRLVQAASFESCFLLFLPEMQYDAKALRDSTQIVVNLISDVDHGDEALPVAEKLITEIGLPVINPPAAIARTDRGSVASTLAGIPDCVVPTVQRLAKGWRKSTNAHPVRQFPALLRVAGTHGGKDFDKVDDHAGFEAVLARQPDADFYLTEFADFRSADGWYRKYRLFFVGDGIYPYHLAIHDHWKVHREATDMANQPWMQAEEALFLDKPEAVLQPCHFAALRTIRERIGLDFFGIDCGIDRDGRLVVFEVNASMLVHSQNVEFPYRTQAAVRITAAFAALLKSRVAPPGKRSLNLNWMVA